MPNKLALTRQQLEKFLPDHQSIRAFEQLLLDVDATPTTIEQANNNANTAIAMATAALSALAEAVSAIEQLISAPVAEPTFEQEDYSTVVYVGTLGVQNDDEVEITGGAISGASIAATTLSASGAVTLSPANANVVISPTGTGLVTIAPATAGTMDNMAIGGVTPSTLRGTTVTATGAFGCNGKTAQTAFALGAAATDLPTVITLANNIRTALINNGIGS